MASIYKQIDLKHLIDVSIIDVSIIDITIIDVSIIDVTTPTGGTV